MENVILNLLCAVVGIVTIAIARYLIPWMKANIDEKQRDEISWWALNGVMYAEQFMQAASGIMRKEVVTNFLKEVRDKNNLKITDEQIEILIESSLLALESEMAVEVYEEEDEEEEV